MDLKIKYFDGTEQTINMGDVSIENLDIDKFKIYKSRNRKNEDVEKRNPDLYDMLFLLKTIFIAIPFVILFEIFVFIPYWFINLLKK